MGPGLDKELSELRESASKISKEKVKRFVRRHADWLTNVATDALRKETLENFCKRCEEYEVCLKENFAAHLDCFCVVFQRRGHERIKLERTLEKAFNAMVKNMERPLEDMLFPHIRRIKAFYDALTEIAQKEGYTLDFEKEKAYPCTERGKKISKKELIKQFGHLREVPSGKWFFEYYLVDREGDEKKQTILRLKERGYDIIFNFYAEDVLRGNIVTKIDDNWFAFGECLQSHYGVLVTEIWPMRYVTANCNRLQVQLRYTIDY